MSAERFTSFLPHLRDRGMPLLDSWCIRYYAEDNAEPKQDLFELWSTKPLYELTAEDLLWCLVAAANNPFATHLHLYTFIGDLKTHPLPSNTLQALIDSLEAEFGFNPSAVGHDFEDADAEHGILVSLFSAQEYERVSEMLERM